MTSKKLVQQRKRIVSDVVAQVEAQRLVPSSTYLEIGEGNDVYWAQFNDRISEKQAYKSPKKCRVCGIGSLFITSIDRYNKLTIGEAGLTPGSKVMIEHLSRWWPDSELRIIEAAFEGAVMSIPDVYRDDYDALTEWRKLAQTAKAWGKELEVRFHKLTRRTQESYDENYHNYRLISLCKKILKHPEGIFRV